MQALAMDSDCSGRKRYFSARQVEKAHRMLPRKYTVEELCVSDVSCVDLLGVMLGAAVDAI